MVPAGRAILTFFSKTLSALTPPFPGPLFSNNLFSSVATEWRLQEVPWPVASPPLEALPATVHFLVGWMEPGGSARGGGAAGQSLPGAPEISWLAGGRVPNAAPALAAAPPPLRVAGRPGGRDNVAGLVTGRRLPSHLKWVLPGCCLARRWGDREKREAGIG